MIRTGFKLVQQIFPVPHLFLIIRLRLLIDFEEKMKADRGAEPKLKERILNDLSVSIVL